MNTSQIWVRHLRLRRGLVFGAIIVTALLSFELFNYSTTEYALVDLLGDLKFAGVRWATILAIAFCGIDFAGIARLFTPALSSKDGSGGPNESWYLFGAWLLAATMNAMLTWWGISLAILGHQTLGNEVVTRETMLRVVPIFVSVLVWLIRVLIIGTFSVAGDRLFVQDQDFEPVVAPVLRPQPQPRTFQSPKPAPRPQALRPANGASALRSASKPAAHNQTEVFGAGRPEPTYHSLSARPNHNGNSSTQPNTTRPGSMRPGGPRGQR